MDPSKFALLPPGLTIDGKPTPQSAAPSNENNNTSNLLLANFSFGHNRTDPQKDSSSQIQSRQEFSSEKKAGEQDQQKN